LRMSKYRASSPMDIPDENVVTSKTSPELFKLTTQTDSLCRCHCNRICEWVSSGIIGSIAPSGLLGKNLISACSCRNELKCGDSQQYLICSKVPPESNTTLMTMQQRLRRCAASGDVELRSSATTKGKQLKKYNHKKTFKRRNQTFF
jgi:hypothetical protein